MTEQQKFESWGLVELFGHQRVVGRITEQSVGGCNFVRVDVLQADGSFYTRLFGSGAIYALNITSEEVARALAQRMEQKPVFAYELQQPSQPRIAAPQTFGNDDDYATDDDRDEEFEDEEQR